MTQSIPFMWCGKNFEKKNENSDFKILKKVQNAAFARQNALAA